MIVDEAFNPKFDYPRRAAERCYLILSAPRTGSTMLSDGLLQTGFAGVPLEYLHRRVLAGLGKPLAFERIAAYFNDIVSRRTSPNGVFGMKIHYHQFADLFVNGEGVTANGESFLGLFSHFILIDRRDRISQAISFMIAEESRKWRSRDVTDAHSSDIALDDDKMIAIVQEMGSLMSEARGWRRIIEARKLNAIELSYEDLTHDFDAEFRRVLGFLGLPEVEVRPQTVKLGGARNRAAKAEFLSRIGV